MNTFLEKVMMLPWALSHNTLASLASVAVSVLEASANALVSLSSACDVSGVRISCSKGATYSQQGERC